MVTAASSRSDVLAALGGDAAQVEAAAKVLWEHIESKNLDDRRTEARAYADAGAFSIVEAAMSTHAAHAGAQQCLCRAVGWLACYTPDRVREY